LVGGERGDFEERFRGRVWIFAGKSDRRKGVATVGEPY